MNTKLSLLFAVFVGLLIGMNTLGVKLVSFFGITVSVGIFMMPITFLITDMVAEVYGKKVVKQFIMHGLIVLAMIFIYAGIFVLLEPDMRYAESNDAYTTIFGGSLRMILASMVAFAISQSWDMWFFEKIKTKTKGKMLWLRNNLSTMTSQLIDSTIFMFIAFYAITPMFTVSFIISLIIPLYIMKVLFAFIDTPFVYLGVKWLRKDTIDSIVANAKI